MSSGSEMCKGPGFSDLRVSLMMADFAGGGAQRMMLHLAEGLAGTGIDTELIVLTDTGPFRDLKPVPVHVLGVSRATRALPRLVAHLRSRRPRILISTQDHVNLLAVAGARLVRDRPLVWVRQTNASLHDWVRRPPLRQRIATNLVGVVCRRSDLSLALNESMMRSLGEHHGVPADKLAVLRNPVITGRTVRDANAVPRHRWLVGERSHKVLVAVGRLTQQKDYPTLLGALARLDRDVRVVIFGEGEDREELESLARDLDIDDRVDFAGWTSNPLAEVRAADLFVMSSLWEGSPNALIEALYCGVRVVSTDCPFGPAEILDRGRLGALVPVRDESRLAEAIVRSLDSDHDERSARDWVVQRYGLEAITDDLIQLIDERGFPDTSTRALPPGV